MYRLTHRIFLGNRLIGYKILNIVTKKYEVKSIPETIDLTQQNKIQNLRYISHRLQGVGIHLSDIPRIQQNSTIKFNKTGIRIYNNQEIITEYNKYSQFNKRDQFEPLYKSAKQSLKIVALYGLRRTGKTVLLIQLAQRLIQEGNNVCYILISKNAQANELFNILDKIRNKYNYILIDEITYLAGFVCWANQLEMYNNTKTKLIVAGTQSFALYMSKNDTLLDRIDFIDTTYISFKEYARLFNGTTLIEYIQNGGVLNRSYLSKELKTYIDSSVVENIVNTLETISDTSYYPLRHIPFDRGTISSILNQIIYNSINYKSITSKSLTFKDKNLSSALQMLQHKLSIREEIIPILRDYTAYLLRIGDLGKRGNDITDDVISYFINTLYDLQFIRFKQICRIGKDVDYIYEIGFNQPGVRYNQSVKTINSIYQYRAQLNLNTTQFEQLRFKLIEDITGRILEEIITLTFMQVYGDTNVFQIQSLNNGEIDVAVQTKHGLSLYEVKLSNKRVDNQARWLVDTDFIKYIESKLITKIIRKSIVYTGDTVDVKIGNEIVHYINATELLLSL